MLRRLFPSILLGITTLCTVLGDKEILVRFSPYNIACEGMYAKPAIFRGGDSTVTVRFYKNQTLDGHVSIAIFDWKDEEKLGKVDPKDNEVFPLRINAVKTRSFLCDEGAINSKLCTKEQRYEYLVQPGATTLKTYIVPLSRKWTEDYVVNYTVPATGYYCALAMSEYETFMAVAEFNNPFGYLSAWEYPKLLFYGGLSLTYLLIFVIWMIKSVMNWSDILPVQKYIAWMILFLTVETAFYYGYWQDYNIRGQRSVVLIVILAILNALRISMSFFILLIVALGYGVVRPTLGGTLRRCQILAVAHFLCGILYASGTMLTKPEDAGLLVFVFVLPLSITMTMFYFWILSALGDTVQALETHKQYVKLNMYQNLWRILVVSILLLTGFFVLNSADYAHRMETDWQSKHWQIRWFLLDGWMNVEYFVMFGAIMWLWRPTSENWRYGLQELAGDERDAIEYVGEDGERVIGEGIMLQDTSKKEKPDQNVYEIGEEEEAEGGDGRGNYQRTADIEQH